MNLREVIKKYGRGKGLHIQVCAYSMECVTCCRRVIGDIINKHMIVVYQWILASP